VDIYDQNGNFLWEIPYKSDDVPGDIAVDKQDRVCLPMFHSGEVLRLSRNSNGAVNQESLAKGLGTAGGLAIDTKGSIYFADFGGNRITKIYA
jgi:streptogramin lyase